MINNQDQTANIIKDFWEERRKQDENNIDLLKCLDRTFSSNAYSKHEKHHPPIRPITKTAKE
ncbi:MAG: hypothetical protein IT292_07215 [Deltaproteobacteria bacterium]|nr:hypothetical protein [Deltaproteobacteria bacterium]